MDLFYGDRLEPRYIRPAGSALGRYSDKAPLDNQGYPKRAGICYRDYTDVNVEYDFVGSRTDGFGGKRDERIVRFIYAVMCEIVEPGSPGKGAGIARGSCMPAYATDNRFGSRGWTISTKYQM